MTDETTPDGPPAAAAPAPEESTPPRKGVFVPRWLAILLGLVVAVVLVGGGGFALGRATGDDDHHDGDRNEHVRDRHGAPGLPNLPGAPNRPNTPNDNGGGRSGPDDSTPAPTGRVLLGVVVRPAGDGTAGARVVEVAPGSPADDAGLEAGDVITKVDDTDVADAAALAAAIQTHSSGDEVTITYDRDGTSATATVTLTESTSSAFPSISPPA
jgi:membrane-associated protease RseP (regulator of RpoE activity)